MRHVVRRTIGVLVVIHGLIHLVGVDDGVGWLAAAVVMTGTGLLQLAGQRTWWRLAVPAAVLSQVLIATDWQEAQVGTVANVLLLSAAAHGWLADGSRGLRAEYRRRAAEAERRASAGAPAVLVTEADLTALPALVADHVRSSGAVGRPRPTGMRARLSGRIRGAPDQPWMRFTGEQVDVFTPRVSRVFSLDATARGLPVDVLHVYADGDASMTGRAMSVFPVMHTSGSAMLRAETVTVFNDMCVLAPASLVGADVTWEAIDEHHVRGTFRNEGVSVSAVLVFDDRHHLVDFVSDDRLRASGGGALVPERWSTPITEYRVDGSSRRASIGTGRWHPAPPAEPFDYVEFHIDDLVMLSPTGTSPAARREQFSSAAD